MNAVNRLKQKIWNLVYSKQRSASQAAKEERHQELTLQNKIAKEKQIVFVGDSITQAFDVEKFFPDHTVYNRGNSGFKTYELLKAINESVVAIKPSKLFILIGTNDMSLYDVTPEMALENTSKIIDIVKKILKDTSIYLISIYLINTSSDKKINNKIRFKRRFYPKKIKELNHLYNKMANEKGITFIDVFSQMKNDNGMIPIEFTIDGVHLSNEGYASVSKVFNKYL